MVLDKARIDELVQPEQGLVDISVYNDEEIFEAELQRIFYKTWVYIGHESEVAQPGDYKTTYIGRIPVILSRDEDGEIHVLINRCAHRGPTVCQREYGNANFFRCEYHGWVYGNDGSLAGVSLRRGFGAGEIDSIEGGLDKAEVATYRGLIWARLSHDGPSLSDHLGLAKQYLDDWMDRSPTGQVEVTGGIWKHADWGNWKLQLDGSNEGYHPDFLHKIGRLVAEHVTSLGGVSSRSPSAGFGAASSAGVDLGNGHSVMGSGGPAFNENWRKSGAPQYVEALIDRLGEERAAQVLGTGWRMNVFPNVCFATNEIRVIRPVSVDRYEVVQYHVTLPGAPEATQEAAIRRHQGFHGPAGYGVPDDLELFGRMREGYRASDYKGLDQRARFVRGVTLESRGPNGERFGHTSSEVEQRASYYAWAALMKGESSVTITGPTSGVSTIQAGLTAGGGKSGGGIE